MDDVVLKARASRGRRAHHGIRPTRGAVVARLPARVADMPAHNTFTLCVWLAADLGQGYQPMLGAVRLICFRLCSTCLTLRLLRGVVADQLLHKTSGECRVGDLVEATAEMGKCKVSICLHDAKH